ncbi:MAG TPA: hypothetical protein VMF91_23380 [Bryobacteraceae bacterium]|nr:hypothetical protein [Bryobacteraceae bacterium]
MSKFGSLFIVCVPLVAWQLWAADPPRAVTPAEGGSAAPVEASAAPANATAPAPEPANSSVAVASADGSASAGAAPNANASTAASTDDLNQLRKRIAEQEEAIKKLQQAVDAQRTLLEKAVQSVNVQGGPATPVVAGADALATAAPVKIVPAVNVARPNIGWQHLETEPRSPLSIHIGDTTFTPLGFVDATFFARSTNVGSGIGTNFGSVPFVNTTGGNISETNFSTQNSRIGFRVDTELLGTKVLGYFEADFLGQPPATVFVTSNADTFRMRNVFVDARKGWFEVLGGQDWSMLTPNRVGLSPIPSDIFYTQNMDTNYQAGLVWSRQTQFRFVAHPSDDFAIGLSLENPQQYGGGSGGGSVITVPTAYASLLTNNSQINNGVSVTSSPSLYGGTNTPNVAPDIIGKAAYDAHLGDRILHFELGGLISNFRVEEGSGTAKAPYTSQSATGYAGEFNMNLGFTKNFRLVENLFWGEGDGRYIFGLAPDFIITANGAISPLHSGSAVDGFEWNLAKKTLISLLYGGVFIDRDVTVVPTVTGSKVTFADYGYGYIGSNQNRAIQEGTADLVETLWGSSNYGKLSLIIQYSYLNRNPWYYNSAAGAPKEGHTNMGYVDLRYTLP